MANQYVVHDIKLNNKIDDGRGYLKSVVVNGNLVLAGLHLGIDSHGAKPSVCGAGDEAEVGQLVLVLPFGLIVARGGRSAVVVEVVVKVAEGGEEGALLGLGLLEVHLLESLSNPPFDLCLPEVYSCLPEKFLFFLGKWATKWSGSPQP